MQLGNFFSGEQREFRLSQRFASGFWPPTSYVAM